MRFGNDVSYFKLCFVFHNHVTNGWTERDTVICEIYFKPCKVRLSWPVSSLLAADGLRRECPG